MTQWRNPGAEVPVEGLEGFYDEFLSNRLSELQQLKTDLDAQQFEAVKKMVHKWKGFCAPYGFGELALLAKEMEEAALTEDLGLCQRLWGQMQVYLASKKR